jgi:hypothetical protein
MSYDHTTEESRRFRVLTSADEKDQTELKLKWDGTVSTHTHPHIGFFLCACTQEENEGLKLSTRLYSFAFS